MCGPPGLGIGSRTGLVVLVLTLGPLAPADAETEIILDAGVSKTVSFTQKDSTAVGAARRSIFKQITGATIEPASKGTPTNLLRITYSTTSVEFDVDEKAAGHAFELSVSSIHEEQNYDLRRRRWVHYQNVPRSRKIPVLVQCPPPAAVLLNPGDRRELRLPGEAKFKRVLTGTLTKVEMSVTRKGRLQILAKLVGDTRARVAYVLGGKELEIPVEVRVVLDRIPRPKAGDDADDPDEPDDPDEADEPGEEDDDEVSAGRSQPREDPQEDITGDIDTELGGSYTERLNRAIRLEKSIDAVAVKVAVVPALRYTLAKAYEELGKAGYEDAELEEKLREVYKKNWTDRDKVLVTLQLKRDTGTKLGTHYFLHEKDPFIAMRQRTRLRFSRLKTSEPPKWETWKVFVYKQNRPRKAIPYKLHRLEDLEQTFSVAKVDLDSKKPIEVTVGGIYRQEESRDSFGSFKDSVDLPSRQISCSGLEGLRLEEEVFTFYPATWKLPKPPEQFERLFERLVARD